MALPDTLYLHGLNLLPQLGPKRLLLLANHFETFQAAYTASQQELLAIGLDGKVAPLLAAHRQKLNLAQEQEKLAKLNIQLLDYRNQNYPKLLLEIPHFPPLLYYRGRMDTADETCLAVVGTRKISNYGRIVTPELLQPIINHGLTIVSGLAYGVDAIAHSLALQHASRTIAVLACGLDDQTIYPPNHRLLAANIISNNGALILEHPPGRAALKQHFVARNRIISGLSLGTLVIECDLQSGALITAKHALDQNRSVYAVPGPIYNQTSQGPNNLLKLGAKAVTEAADILQDLNITPTTETATVAIEINDHERQILQQLSFEPLLVDELIKRLQLDAEKVTSTLTFLEMKDLVRNVGGQQYILAKKLKT